jgi:hypothetical protein
MCTRSKCLCKTETCSGFVRFRYKQVLISVHACHSRRHCDISLVIAYHYTVTFSRNVTLYLDHSEVNMKRAIFLSLIGNPLCRFLVSFVCYDLSKDVTSGCLCLMLPWATLDGCQWLRLWERTWIQVACQVAHML